MLNIGGDQADKSYRYKMPKLLTKIEGRGNGIKTVIPNMTDIAKALRINPAYPTKFFGIELGAQSKFDKKRDEAIVNGAHQAPDMQALLFKFIELFILCPTCGLPEIKMDVKKTTIKIDCAACGHNGLLPTQNKLVTYILKHPPDSKKKPAAEAEAAPPPPVKAEKEDNKKEKGEKPEKPEKPEKAEKGDKKKKKKEKASEGSDEEAAGGGGAEDGEAAAADGPEAGEVTWFTDVSKEAQKQRKEQEFAEMKAHAEASKSIDAILGSAKADNKIESPVTVLKIFLAKERSVPEIVSEVRRLQLARGLDGPQRLKVLLEALIDTSDPKTVAPQFAKNAQLLAEFAQEKNGMTLIGCIEELVGVTDRALLPRIPMILQALYDADVLSEGTLLTWADSPPESSWLVNKEVATQVRDKAKPFIDWLRSASESE